MEENDPNDPFVLRMEGISKTFPGVKALDNVTLRVRPGTVHTLMGENGAGKSTLMKVLCGAYQPDGGKVILNGREVSFRNNHDAIQHGISMIHQELNTIPDMTVADNIFLGHAPSSMGLMRDRAMMRGTTELFRRLGMEPIPPATKMRDLTIAHMQMVEIAKAVSYDSRIIIMDEPTSAIADKEVEVLFRIIDGLKNVAIIYISHRMDEIFRISDEITVLRDGQFVGTKNASELDNAQLVKMMVGRELKDIFTREYTSPGDPVLDVRGLSRKGKFHNVNFTLHKGEILGFTGLVGSGRTEIAEALFGIAPADSGDIFIAGERKAIRRPKDAIDNGIALLTEDRKLQGLFLDHSVKRNTSISHIRSLSRMHLVNVKREREIAGSYVGSLRIKTPSIGTRIGSLSGGNQQKTLIARWLMLDPDIMILDEPTRGIDVGAKQEIYALIDDLTKKGKAIILISSEMPEVISMCDRVIVMNQGNPKAKLEHGFTQEEVMRHAAHFEDERR